MTTGMDENDSTSMEVLSEVLMIPPIPTDPPPICLEDASIIDEENPCTCALTSMDVLSSVVPILPNSLDPPPPTCLRDASSVGEEIPSTSGQLHIEFSVNRIVTVIFVVVSVIIPIVVIFNRGVILGFVKVQDYTTAIEIHDAIQYYNSIARFLMSSVTKVVDVALQLLTTVTLLCYAANWTIRHDASNLLKSMAPLLLAAAASYVVCNGPNTINALLKHEKNSTSIEYFDLSTRDPSKQTTDFTNLAWNSFCSENTSSNPILNTILRSQLQQTETGKARCPKSTIMEPPRVSFGYTSADWMNESLPTALTPEKNAILLPQNMANTAIKTENLPFDYATAGKLLTMALGQLIEKFGGFMGIDYDVAKYETAALYDLLTDYIEEVGNGSFVIGSREILQEVFSDKPGIVTDEVKAEYHHFQISDTLEFNALTLTIQVKPNNSESKHRHFIPKDDCTSEGCVLINEASVFGNISAAIMPGVQTAALCNSTTLSVVDRRDCNLAIVSTGKKLSGDNLHASDGYAVATELRTVFTLTVGLLNWNIEDLGVIYNTTCKNSVSGGCMGIRVDTQALNETEQVLLLGVDELYMNELSDLGSVLFSNYSKDDLVSYINDFFWKDLVKVEKAPTMLLPRNFERVENSFKTQFPTKKSHTCLHKMDQYIRNVLANHLYAEESLQMSYAAGLFYLFRNGVLHGTWKQGNKTMVDFLGTTHDVHMQVSIPTTNAITSYVGCGLLAAIAIWIAVTHKRASRVIETEAANNITIIAEAILNTDKYPRSMLRLSLDQPAPDGGASRRTKLKNLELTSTVFGTKPAMLDRSAKLDKPHWPDKFGSPHWVTKLIKSPKSNTLAHENVTMDQGDASSSTSGSDPSSGEASTHSAA